MEPVGDEPELTPEEAEVLAKLPGADVADVIFLDLAGNVMPQRGGPGSGHHGHAGRPGQVGGSAPGGGGEKQAAQSGGTREVVGSGGRVIGEGIKTYQEREYVGVQNDLPSSTMDAIRTGETDLYSRGREDREKAYVVDESGETIIEKIGTGWDDAAGAQVLWTNEEMAAMAGATLTHSHPSGRAFSPDDIAFACRNHLAEIRAVGTDTAGNRWLYRFQPAQEPSGGWNVSSVAAKYGLADASVYNDWLPKISSFTRTWAENNHGHEVMTRFSIAHPEVVGFYGREKVN